MSNFVVLNNLEKQVAKPTVLNIGTGLAVAVWESNTAPNGRLLPTVNGSPAPRPYSVLTHAAPEGGFRTFILLAPLQHVAEDVILSVHDTAGLLVAETRIVSGPIVQADFSPLLSGLGKAAQYRVLRFLVNYCLGTSRLRTDPAVVEACRGLVLQLSPNPSPLRSSVSVTEGLSLFSGGLPVALGEPDQVIVIGSGRLHHNPFLPCRHQDRVRSGRVPIDLVVEAQFTRSNSLLVFFGRSGLACRKLEPSAGKPLELHRWLERGKGVSGCTRDYLTGVLAGRTTDPQASAALREVMILLPQQARRVASPARALGADLEVAISHKAGGLFLGGWVWDPHELVESVRIRSLTDQTAAVVGLKHRFPRPDVEAIFRNGDHSVRSGARSGFVSYLPEYSTTSDVPLQYRAELVLRSGATIEVVPAPQPHNPAEARAAVLGSIPPQHLTPAVLADVIGPPTARLHKAYMEARREAEIFTFGAPVAQPAVTAIVPLYKNLEFVRFQLAAFASDPTLRDVEMIFVLDSPEQGDELRHFLQGLYGLYRMPMTLVTNGCNLGYSAANNVGAALARGWHLLFLNSDVIPDRSGWLPALANALEQSPEIGAVGPKLLFDDHSLQHAGLYFSRDFRGRWINQHYFKGMPRDFPPACQPRSVPGVTGACLLIRRDVYEKVGGFTEDYVIGDYEDSDLCLKVRASGHDIRYVPSVELYHLERQSITKHTGYTRGVAAEYNNWLHTTRWDGLMEDLMSRPWKGPSPTAKRTRRHRGAR